MFRLKLNAKRSLAAGLVVGLIWQIGACPCGCVHHNLWLQMYERLAGKTELARSRATIATVDSEDCDHRPRDVFLRSRTVIEDNRPILCQDVLPASLTGTMTSSIGRKGLVRVVNSARLPDAQEVRAHLQVFRL